MLYPNNLLPIVTRPTPLTYHSATLIDHIYTNSTSKIVSGIVMVDISDHLPVVCVTNIPVKKHNPIKYYRDYSNFDQESYLQDINAVNWNAIYSNNLLKNICKKNYFSPHFDLCKNNLRHYCCRLSEHDRVQQESSCYFGHCTQINLMPFS